MMASAQVSLALITVFSILFRLDASYVGTPKAAVDLRAALKKSIEFKCEYTGGDGNGQFVKWFKDGAEVSTAPEGHYAVTTTLKESVLTIKVLVAEDEKVNRWYATTTKSGFEEPAACRFGPIKLIPSPQAIETDRKQEKLHSSQESVRRNQNEALGLTCLVLPTPDLNDPSNVVQWEFSNDDKNFTPDLPENVVVNKNELNIDHVKKIHRGYYRCGLNNITFTVLLRVKDRLAALWPFVGIVCTVILCVIVILLIEKRQKAAKKALAAEDETHDQANDPLVRGTANTDEQETKKRAVNA